MVGSKAFARQRRGVLVAGRVLVLRREVEPCLAICRSQAPDDLPVASPQRRFQVFLQELAEPAINEHEVHVDPVLLPAAPIAHRSFVGWYGSWRLQLQQIFPASRCLVVDARSLPMQSHSNAKKKRTSCGRSLRGGDLRLWRSALMR